MSIGDIAHVGGHPPSVAAVYHYDDQMFTLPLGFDLVRTVHMRSISLQNVIYLAISYCRNQLLFLETSFADVGCFCQLYGHNTLAEAMRYLPPFVFIFSNTTEPTSFIWLFDI